MPIETHCARCLAPAPAIDQPDFLEWEALDDEGSLIACPDCITPEEQQAMDEADMDETALAETEIDLGEDQSE